MVTRTPSSSKTLAPNVSESSGVLLVGHGTRDSLGTKQFFQLSEKLAQQLSSLSVRPCLLEFQSPTIPEAWEELAKQGATHIHVAPLLLFAAGHAKQDIPDLISQCHADWPQVAYDFCRPISRQADLVDLVRRRIQEVVQIKDLAPHSSALVMVGRGSRDPCASADMKVLTEVIAKRFGFSQTLTAYYAMAEPRVPEVLDQLASSGKFQSIVVQPHLLFHGRLYQAICKQVDEASQRHPQIRFATCDYLGPEIEIAKAIAARINYESTRAIKNPS